MTKQKKLTYKKSGVDYTKIDPVKILAQMAAKKTAKNIASTGFKEVKESRGESAYVIDCGDFYLASIAECLGTKSLVADSMRKTTGKTYYNLVAQDTIAMAVNDLITVGARPISIHAYWAAGNSTWFDDKKRSKDLVNGWKKSCDMAGANWGGGETPALGGVIKKNTIDLAASCVGIIKPKTRLTLGQKLATGDVIIMFESKGIQANGLTLARKIAKKLPRRYATKISNNKFYGEELLIPTIIYAPLLQSLFQHNVDIHYCANITGHGWQKLMRHSKSFIYRITNIPPIPHVLQFMVKNGPLTYKQAYKTLNMGAGFAIFIPKTDVKLVLSLSEKAGIKSYVTGHVEKGKKQVIIEPLSIVYKGTSLSLRA